MSYSTLPPRADKAKVQPFRIHVPQDDIDQMRQLIELARIAPQTFENSAAGTKYGVQRDWLLNAREVWLNGFNWRHFEERLNTLNNYEAKIVDDDGSEHTIHFMALFSNKTDATPVMALHGWPGSFLEFKPMVETLQKKYNAESLPFHFIVPSLPGYAFSSGPPPDKDFKIEDICRLLDKLMSTLGFTQYIVQGGDIGAGVARGMASTYANCKAVHAPAVNFMYPFPRPSQPAHPLSATETHLLSKNTTFFTQHSAYITAHATRTSTLSLALQTSPLALLAWIGEQFLSWSSDSAHPIPHITVLEFVSLYWLTDTIARCLYPYREFAHPDNTSPPIPPYQTKPLGFSSFAHDTCYMPRAWAGLEGNLVFVRYREYGGHFVALECAGELLGDLEEFMNIVKKGEGVE